MRSMGLRLWSEKMAIVVLGLGDDDQAVVIDAWHGRMPPELGPGRLDWVFREVEQSIQRYAPQVIGVRVTEPTARGGDDLRAEAEGVAQLAAFRASVRVLRLTRTSMSPALGTQAKGAFADFPKSDPLIATLKADERDAGMAALAALRSK